MPAQPVAPPRLRRKPQPVADGDRCELCGAAIAADVHDHIADLDHRSLLCACRACHLLFTPDGAGGRRFRAVPDRYLRLDLEAWAAEHGAEALLPGERAFPVSVVFFLRSSELERVIAFYPGPAGATESLLPVGAGDAFELLTPDVEALLVRDREGFVVPIDACYELVGQLRMLWRGFDGGREATAALEQFFDDVRARAR
jgi:hypothetical protein